MTDAVTIKQAFTISQFCEAYEVSRPWVYARWKVGDGPPRCQVGGKILIPCDGAYAWLQDHASPLAT